MGLCEGLGQIFDGMVYSNDILGYTLKYFTLIHQSDALCWLTNIQTTSLQMINHIKSSQQLVNIINKNNIFANSLLRFIKQFTNSKQDVNQSFTRG